MSADIEQINIEFHNRANTQFFFACNNFQTAIKTIDRVKEEFLYQQIREKHIKTLQQQLTMLAKEIIKTNQDHKQLNQVDQNLQHFLKEYLHRFVQKVN
jgi:hypothetical protein